MAQNIMGFIDAELQKIPSMKTGVSFAVNLVKPLSHSFLQFFYHLCMLIALPMKHTFITWTTKMQTQQTRFVWVCLGNKTCSIHGIDKSNVPTAQQFVVHGDTYSFEKTLGVSECQQP